MKVREIQLEGFKRFENLSCSFVDERGRTRDLVVLVGPNGCGKSSVLQAIAAMLGLATGRLSAPGELAWPGFDWERAGRAWNRAPSLCLTVELSQPEFDVASAGYFKSVQFRAPSATSAGADEVELHGRGMMVRLAGALSDRPPGQVYWYDEHRSLTSVLLGGQSAPMTLDLLRARLAQMQNFHGIVLKKRGLRPGERDLYAELEARWASVFPGRAFEGISISDRPDTALDQPPFFLLDAEGRPYELGEMSGAERAVFPLLFDFANWNIHNSVILIDELELHLHPPLQQALLRVLPRLGHNNQFIVTTHSDFVADLVPPGALIRVGEE